MMTGKELGKKSEIQDQIKKINFFSSSKWSNFYWSYQIDQHYRFDSTKNLTKKKKIKILFYLELFRTPDSQTMPVVMG